VTARNLSIVGAEAGSKLLRFDRDLPFLQDIETPQDMMVAMLSIKERCDTARDRSS